MNNLEPPDLHIAFAKCGSTSLAKSLNGHSKVSQIWTHKEQKYLKEPDYYQMFKKPFNPAETPKHWVWRDGIRYRLDATPHYFMLPYFHSVMHRIINANVGTKFIFVLRNPVDQLISCWAHASREDWGKKGMYKDFDWFVNEFLDSEDANTNYTAKISDYPFWIDQIRLKGFDPHILLFEDLIENPQARLNEIQDFLGLQREHLTFPHILKTPNPLNVKKKTLKTLRKKFTDRIEHLIEVVPSAERYLNAS